MGIFLARSPAVFGGLLAVATLPLHLLFSKMESEQFAAILLAFIGAIYVGFGLQTGNRAQIVMEVMAALGFFSAALVGLWFTPWIVPVAYVIHGIWDCAHHKGSRLVAIPLMVSAILRRLRLGGGGGLSGDMEPPRLNKAASYAA